MHRQFFDEVVKSGVVRLTVILYSLANIKVKLIRDVVLLAELAEVEELLVELGLCCVIVRYE